MRTQRPRAPNHSRGRRAAPPLDRVLEQDGGRATRETDEATSVGRYCQGNRTLRRGGSVGSHAAPPDDSLRGDAPAQRYPASPERVRESALDADRSQLGTRAVDSGARARERGDEGARRSMTAEPAESCQSLPGRCPWGHLGSVLYTRKRLRRMRRRFKHFWPISLSRPLGLAIF